MLGRSRNITSAIRKMLHASALVSKTDGFLNMHAFISCCGTGGASSFSRNVQTKASDFMWKALSDEVSCYETRRLCQKCMQANIFQSRSYAPKATTVDLTLRNPAIQNYLETLLEDYNQANKEMVSMEDTRDDTLAHLSRTISRLKPVVEMYMEYSAKQDSIKESEELIQG